MINKIISTSVFGENIRYIVGAKKQVMLAKHFYPDWQFRIYTDDGSKFSDTDANIIEVKNFTYGVFWRFFPFFESNLNITIVRDADSRITSREAMAVYEWMASIKRFHSIKDHETHDFKPILAGMCGLKGKLGKDSVDAIYTYLHGEKKYGEDERYLSDHVFPYVKDSTMEHHWSRGWFGLSRMFLYNKYEFVGNGWYEDEKPVYAPNIKESYKFDGRALLDSAKFSSYPAACK